jgi:hypothetical protein
VVSGGDPGADVVVAVDATVAVGSVMTFFGGGCLWTGFL